MLKNSNELTEVTNRQKFPKNNYFCYRWRILDYFSTSADRQKHQQELLVGGKDRSLLSDKILQLHKARYQGSRQDLIADLAQDAMQFLDRRRKETRKTSEENRLFSKAIRDLMQRTFKTLLAFSTELNTLLGLSELFITASEPEVAGRVNNDETMPYVQCSLSTKLFRLLVDGRHDTIAFYLLPTDNIGALTDLEPYTPVVEWKAQVNSQKGVFWISETGALTGEMLEVASAELLRLLLGATQEMLSPNKSVDERNANFDLLEVDPWLNEGRTSDNLSSDFDAKSGFNLAEPIQSKFEIKKKRDGWKTVNDSPVTQFSQPAAAPVSKPLMPETQSYSITISTNYQSAPVAVPMLPPNQASAPANSTEETRTDSVPSLQSLMNQSGEYSTALKNAPIAVEPVILAAEQEVKAVTSFKTIDDSIPPAVQNSQTAQVEAPPANIFANETLIYNAKKAAAPKPTFDLKGEYFADKPQKNSSKGLANKRSTRKTNSKKNKKKK